MSKDVRAAPNLARIGLAGRFGVAGGLLAITLGGAFVAIDFGLRHIQSGIETVVAVAQPMAKAAFEMEINAIGAGMAVVKYLHVPDAAHRQRFQKNREDFQGFLQRYRDLASTDRQRELAARIETRHQAYMRTAEFLIDAKDLNDRELAAIIASLREIRGALGAEIETRTIGDRRRQAVVADMVDQLKTEILRIPLLLADIKWADDANEGGIAETFRTLRAQFTELARRAPEQSLAVQRLSAKFEAIVLRVDALGRTQGEMAEGLQRLILLRDEIDQILDDEIQMLTGEYLDQAMDDVIQEVRNSRLVLGGGFSALLVSLVAMFVYTVRGVVRPIRRLVAYAAEVGRGNFTASVDVTGVAEVGVLARAGAEMAGALQSARETMARELAERAKMQESLHRSERMVSVGQLAGGIAHDFNNMLMVMGGHADRAVKHAQKPEVVAKSLKEIQTAIGNAANVIRRISIFSGRRALDPKVFELARFRHEIEGLVEPTVGKNYVIAYDFPDAGARIKCDPTELTQAVLNLVINASHASPLGSTIWIAAAAAEFTAENAPAARPPLRPGRYAVISVADQGTGIPDAVLPRIFEPYFTTKPQGTGTGLGLASVYGFAAQSGGGVSFTTESGQGTTFFVYLPVTERSADVLQAQDPNVARGNGESILLVDDDANLVDLLHEVLTDLGYTVHAAASGFEAVEIASEPDIRIDLMLSDVVMPAMTGVEAYEIIKDDRPALPVVFMSGATDRFADVAKPESAAFLQKPVQTPLLAKTLRSALAGNKPKQPSPNSEPLVVA